MSKMLELERDPFSSVRKTEIVTGYFICSGQCSGYCPASCVL